MRLKFDMRLPRFPWLANKTPHEAFQLGVMLTLIVICKGDIFVDGGKLHVTFPDGAENRVRGIVQAFDMMEAVSELS